MNDKPQAVYAFEVRGTTVYGRRLGVAEEVEWTACDRHFVLTTAECEVVVVTVPHRRDKEGLMAYTPLPDEAIQTIQDRWRDNAPDSSGQSHPQAKIDITDLLKERDHYKASSRQWESLARSNELDQKDSPNPTVFALEFEPPPATRRQMWDVMAQRWVNIAD